MSNKFFDIKLILNSDNHYDFNFESNGELSFDKSLDKDKALKLYEIFNNKLRETNLNIKTGCFGEKMEVNLINDGPVTIIIDSREWFFW